MPSTFIYAAGPIQQPRIPVWVVGVWPNKAPFRRAARWDGVFPIGNGPEPLSPWKSKRSWPMFKPIGKVPNRSTWADGYKLTGNDQTQDAAQVARYAEAGVTWWVESPEECSLEERATDLPWPTQTDEYSALKM